MQEYETRTIDGFIRLLLMHEILLIDGIFFNAIVGLKKAHNEKAFSKR